MNLNDARIMAREAMNTHGLTDWSFAFDGSKRRFGQCRYRTQEIVMSRSLVLANKKEEVRNTILHEIAHALVGPGFDHGPVWERKAAEIGCTDTAAKYDALKVAPAADAWKAVCPMCGVLPGTRAAKPKRVYSCKAHGLTVSWIRVSEALAADRASGTMGT